MKTLKLAGDKYITSDRLYTYKNEVTTIETGETGAVPLSGNTPQFVSIANDTMANPVTATFTLQVTKKDLQWLLKAAPKSDVRYYLNGIAYSPNLQTLVATDGHRLHAKTEGGNCKADLRNWDSKSALIFDRNFIQRIVQFMPAKQTEIEITQYDQPYVSVTIDNIKILGRTIDGRFPDLPRVIPRDYAVSLELNDISKLARISKLLAQKDKFPTARIHPDGSLTHSQGTTSGIFKPRKSDDVLGVNPNYVVDMLSVPAALDGSEIRTMGGIAALELSLRSTNSYFALVMPCRV